MTRLLARLRREVGQTTTEYAVVLVLIVAAVATALSQVPIGSTIVDKITNTLGF
jgi:Flp pilus assembly pilin Flp